MKWILVRNNLNRGLRMHWQFTLYKVAWFSSQSHFTYYGLMLYKLRKTSQEMEDLLRELEDDIIIKSEDVILNYFYIIRCYYFFIIQWRQSIDYIFWNFEIFILHNLHNNVSIRGILLLQNFVRKLINLILLSFDLSTAIFSLFGRAKNHIFLAISPRIGKGL